MRHSRSFGLRCGLYCESRITSNQVARSGDRAGLHHCRGLGIPVWCQDEAGPYQAIPQPGSSWQPAGQPAHRPHEYLRGGTTKLLTLFRPATGDVRALPVERALNVVLHPWLQAELDAILATVPLPEDDDPVRRAVGWAWDETTRCWAADVPPIRLLLIWDNLAWHHSGDLMVWLLERGVWPLFTPLGGSWLNLAESIQGIVIRRALEGQPPQTTQEVMDWLAAAVLGCNADPTPFAWGGQRGDSGHERAAIRWVVPAATPGGQSGGGSGGHPAPSP